MSGKAYKQNEKQTANRAKSTIKSAASAQSSTSSKSTTVNPCQGSKGYSAGSRFAADPDLVDEDLNDNPTPKDQDADEDWVKVEDEGHSSHVGHKDHPRKYNPGFGQSEENKDVDQNYEDIEKPEHSAYNGQGDHWRKYKPDEVEKGHSEPEKKRWSVPKFPWR